MEDSSSDSSSVSDFLSLDGSNFYNTDTCDSLIAGFQQCKVVDKKILSPQNNSTQGNSKITGFHLQSPMLNNDSLNQNNFETNITVESTPECSSNNKPNQKPTCEIGVNTDECFNNKPRNFKQPYFKFKKHLSQYHHFRHTYQTYNSISKKQHKKLNNYKYHNQNYISNNRWQFKKHQWEEERTTRGFYFFTQLMKCFNGKF